MHRVNWIYDMSYHVVKAAFPCFLDRRYEDAENIPRNGPVIILPKHQSNVDILVEGLMLYETAGRRGYWVMKDKLPAALGLIGGIKIKRPSDLYHIRNRSKRKRAAEEMDTYNARAFQFIRNMLRNGEPIVIHPEGTRSMGRMRQLKSELIGYATQWERDDGLIIPVVPMGIEYQEKTVIARVGPSLFLRQQDLMGVVAEEIAKLSGISRETEPGLPDKCVECDPACSAYHDDE